MKDRGPIGDSVELLRPHRSTKRTAAIIVGALFAILFAILVALFVMSRHSDPGLIYWAVILSAVLTGICIPVKFYGQKLSEVRLKRVSDFINQHEGQIVFCSHSEKREGDILVHGFCGFLLDGHRFYLLLNPAQDGQKALLFIQRLQAICFANNSWHLDLFTNRIKASLYYKRARRAFS